MGLKCVVGLSLRILTLCVAAASAATCTHVPSDRLADTILALDRSIDALTDPTADVRTILAGLASRLGPEAETSVRSAIVGFLARVPEASADFQCSPEFVRLRARQELIRLEATLRNTAAAPAEPEFCYATPFAIDLTRAPDTIEIYGYDFDVVPVEMFLVTRDGYHDVSAALIHRTHYHLTFVLGDRGVKLSPDARVLGLTWGNLIHHAIAVVDSSTPMCSCTIQQFPGGQTVDDAPSLVRPDRRSDSSAGSPAAWANALVDYQSNELSATVCMTVTGQRSDGAVRSGCVRAFVLTIDPDRRIEWLFGRRDGRATRSAETATPPSSALLRQWKFSGFAADTASPQVTIELGTIRLVSTGGEGCISPIAYLEGRRTGALSAATVRALDRQLTTLDPEILGLRPRFAPAIR